MLACALLLTATACATGDPVATAALASKPIPPGNARVSITRQSTILYAAAPATITLNGNKVADIGPGGSALVDVPAGPNVLAVSAWSYPGQFSVKLNAVAGQKYALEVAPRSDSFAPGMLLGPVGGVIDASVNENAGAFEMKAAGGSG